MGCTNSKVISAGEVVPAKIRPHLLRRYEELKKRRQKPVTTIQRESTLSKKKLLKEEEEEDANSNSSLETEAVVYKAVVASPRKPEPAKVVPLPETECKAKENIENQENGKDTETRAVVGKAEKGAENEQEGVDEKNHDNDDDDEEEEEEEEIELGTRLTPGSPSFKIYCVPEKDQEGETESFSANSNKSMNQEKATHPKSSSEESVEGPPSGQLKSPSFESIQSAASSENSKTSSEKNVETGSSTKRKGNKKKKFRDVKKLLKVKSFYPSCTCAGNDNTRLLGAEAVN